MRAWVDKAHSRVKGGEKDNAYDAMDPELQLWVAATVYASMVSMYELIYGPLPPAMGERVYQAYSIMGTLLQVPREIWPTNLRAFRVYWRDMVENHLEATVDARMVLEVLWHPNGIPFWIKPAVWVAMPFIRRITAEKLPPAIREQFALRSTKSSRAMSSLFITGMSGVYPLVPRSIRTLPKTYSMRLVRKRMNKRGGQLGKD